MSRCGLSFTHNSNCRSSILRASVASSPPPEVRSTPDSAASKTSCPSSREITPRFSSKESVSMAIAYAAIPSASGIGVLHGYANIARELVSRGEATPNPTAELGA